MGNEIIIPGTPLADIPPQDRPVFDPRLQNGYLTGSPTSPPPGSSVEHYVLNVAPAGIALAIPVDHDATNNFSLASAAQKTLLQLLPGFYSGTPLGNYSFILQALGAVTTGKVWLTNQSPGTDDISLTDLKTLVIPRGRFADGASGFTLLGVLNTDVAAQTIGIAAILDLESIDFNYYTIPLPMPAGVLLNPANVLRIRYVSASLALLATNGDVEFAEEIDLAYFIGTPAPSFNSPPAANFKMRGNNPRRWYQPSTVVAGLTAPILYSLEVTRDILGTDFNNHGAVYAPYLQVGFWAKPRNSSATSPTVVASVSAQIDIYRGANQ